MAPRRDIREVVDDLLATEKIPAGQPEWTDSAREGDKRLLYPLLVGGEISDATLTIIAYPRVRRPTFRLILSFAVAIWRLDFVHDEIHVNSHDRPADLPSGPFEQPHFHSWPDNRRFATAQKLPERLRNARILPANVRAYDNAFRWFCGETRIVVPADGVPELPQTDRFL